ncbi:DUF417 family protein [Enterobacter sp. CFBP8995]|nr:DUF417 family protein [Enterobacter sp. CFBP8995]
MTTAKQICTSRVVHFLASKEPMVLRLSVIIIFLVFGMAKWFEFEVQALEPIFTKTWLSIFPYFLGLHGSSYFLGVVELTTVILLIAGFKRPDLGMIGAGLLILTGLVTLSLLPQLGGLDSFIFKDIMVVAIGLTLLKRDIIRWKNNL